MDVWYAFVNEYSISTLLISHQNIPELPRFLIVILPQIYSRQQLELVSSFSSTHYIRQICEQPIEMRTHGNIAAIYNMLL